MTKAEADVHNEINQKHLSRKLGMELFSTKERMVRETEVHKLFGFLDFTEKRVGNKGTVISSCEVCLVYLDKSVITLVQWYAYLCCRIWLASSGSTAKGT